MLKLLNSQRIIKGVKAMRKIMIVLLIIIILITPVYAKTKKKPKAKTTSSPQTISISSLQGKWNASGNGSGTDPRQPGVNLSLNAEDIIMEIENIKFSESTGEGRADVIFMGKITDISNNTRHIRSWEYSVPYDMKQEGVSSWSFSTEYLDGEDKITMTLTGAKTAIMRWEGANWDDVYPEDIDTFDVTCTAQKQ